jgi:capsule biosynthesis phosphatase
MNIIIPIGGLGERFKNEKYTFPKPLIKSLGKSVIFWNIENIRSSAEDTIYIVYRKEFDIFNFQDLINNKFRDKNIKFIKIENDTRGASETVLYGLNEMSPDELMETTLVLDSDSFYVDDVVGVSKMFKKNLIFYAEDKGDSPIFSYIKIEESGKVIDIKEKEKISDLACVGAYCFKSGEILKNTIKDILIKGERYKNEYYISDVYKKLLTSEEEPEVISYKIENFVCLGTPNQLKSFSSNISKDGEKYRFCFDLDNTLVTYPRVKNDYSTVEPILRNVNFCNFLKELGHTIIIYTARRMRTHGGNVGAVVGDIASVTIETLNKFGISYDELYFGKPYAHFYIDDLAVKSFEDLEKETGFYNIHPKARSHNKIDFKEDSVLKHSLSISGERYFYENIPADISKYFPKLIESGEDFIRISKVEGVPISFLNTSKILNEKTIIGILSAIGDIHSSAAKPHHKDLYSNYYDKFKRRTDEYDFSEYADFEKIKNEVSEFLKSYQEKKRGVFTVIHGDPVFTNILINNSDELKFIDMRGKVGDEKTIFGDSLYDYAKIYQSIIGYDFILMGKDLDYNYIENNKVIFEKFITEKFGSEILSEIKWITKSLLISLIPIHRDDKCKGYFGLLNNI